MRCADLCVCIWLIGATKLIVTNSVNLTLIWMTECNNIYILLLLQRLLLLLLPLLVLLLLLPLLLPFGG